MSKTTIESLFSVREVARVFDLNESRIRYWASTGIINPSGSREGKRLYTFVDLVSIRAAKELLEHGISLQRVRRNLQALREALPQLEQPLTQLRVRSDGDQLVVEQREGAFDPISGQMQMNFEIQDLSAEVAQLLDLSRPPVGPTHTSEGEIKTTSPGDADALLDEEGDPDEDSPAAAYRCFLMGCALEQEEDRLEEARTCFERAVVLDPSLASAFTNLGNIHYREGDRAGALRNYQTACTLDPDQPEAHFNLANLFEEEGDLEMAIAEHRRAVQLDPAFPDAHFNLALTLEQVGSRVQAVNHWQEYLSLCGESSAEDQWTETARTHLMSLKQGKAGAQETTSSGN